MNASQRCLSFVPANDIIMSRDRQKSTTKVTLISHCNFFLGVLKRQVDIVQLVRGESSKIQAANSDVILYTPRGIKGVILANIYTNHRRFLKHISERECLVSPICEYFLKPYLEDDPINNKENSSTMQPKDQRYMLRIPHVIKDVDRVENHICVKHGNIHSVVPPLIVQQNPNSRQPDHFSFTVDQEYVNIYTDHFSGFIVTIKDINCCSGSAYALMFGSLKKVPEQDPLVTLKVYLSNHLVKIEDNRSVSDIQIN